MCIDGNIMQETLNNKLYLVGSSETTREGQPLKAEGIVRGGMKILSII